MRNEKGFTLIELLIVVAIIGIIAAIAIPNLLNAIENSRQKTTLANMRALATAIEQYTINNPAIGAPPGDIAALETMLINDQYVTNNDIFTDAWGFDLNYAKVGGAGAKTFSLTSYGSDGAAGPAPTTAGVVEFFQEDLIFYTESFTQAPKGNQKNK